MDNDKTRHGGFAIQCYTLIRTHNGNGLNPTAAAAQVGCLPSQ